jgi:hypothetical protein
MRFPSRTFLTVNFVAAWLLAAALLTVGLARTAGADSRPAATTAAPAPVAPTPPPALPVAAVAAAPAKPALPHGCPRLYTQQQFASTARVLFRGRHHPGSRARLHLTRMTRCQHSRSATRNAQALQRRLVAAQRAAAAAACSNTNVPACIRDASNRWHVSYAKMLSRAMCESTLNPSASNGTHFGIYQFLPSTWRGETSYGSHSYWSARWAALGAAEMEAKGMGGQWECTG